MATDDGKSNKTDFRLTGDVSENNNLMTDTCCLCPPPPAARKPICLARDKDYWKAPGAASSQPQALEISEASEMY